MLAGSKARAVAFSQTVIFVQHVNFDFQHPTLAHARRVSARFAMTVMQVAFFSLAGGKFRRFNAGDFHLRACRRGKWRATKRGMRVMFITLDIQVAFTATACCTHRSLLVYFYPPNL
ncbi:Uncharacterised protein [Shigella sonnei]|nr:Uncharacterised protein [Shigella sonnei]CSF84806.1 Uncharacterised protein [Shigella sonnei]